jgi:hypothetical protein
MKESDGRQSMVSSSSSSAAPSTSSALRPDITAMKHVAPPPATRTQFSFLSDPEHRSILSKQYKPTHGVVPNNDAKVPLPMWSSSLTSPKLELQRMKLDSWIAPHLSAGFHEDSAVERFVSWVSERADAAEREAAGVAGAVTSSYLSYALKRHVQLKLRAGGSCRGVFARRSFAPGDVILSIPTAVGGRASTGEFQADDSAPTSPEPSSPLLWGLTLNSDTLRKYSVAAQQRCVPSYETVWEIVSKRRSSFDPYTHPLFADQIYSALFLACEKEAGEASPLYPYLSLLPDPAVDDDRMLEIHQGVLTPASHLEYHDHKNRFHLYVYHIQNAWHEAQEAAKHSPIATAGGGVPRKERVILPPPSEKTITWAMRTVLSRQLMMPNLRPRNSDMTDRLARETTLSNILDQENFWMRNITKLRQWWLQHVFRVLDMDRMKQFEFDAATIPTVAPLLDMLQHDAKGGNVVWEVETNNHTATSNEKEDDNTFPSAKASCHSPELLLVATKPITEGQELTRSFRRCYSTSYTLFRYGFLAVNDREADLCSDLVDAGVDPMTIGWDRPDIHVPRLQEAMEKAKRLKSSSEKRQRLAQQDAPTQEALPVMDSNQ